MIFSYLERERERERREGEKMRVKTSVTRKKSPNVSKSCSKMISLEK